MKIYEAYNTLLTETKFEACVKNFGHELFGHELGGKEPNTGMENAYVRDIEDFTDNKYGQEIEPSFIKALETLKSCMGKYKEVLVPEKTTVYRGITIPLKYFVDHKQPINFSNPNPYIYKASSKIQSWSNDFDAASTFGGHEILNGIADEIDFNDYATPEARQQLLQQLMADDLRIGFVLEYKTNPQEFIFKSKYFRILSAAHHEDELIRIDNKPIKVNAKFNEHEDVFLTSKAFRLLKYINAAILGK